MLRFNFNSCFLREQWRKTPDTHLGQITTQTGKITTYIYKHIFHKKGKLTANLSPYSRSNFSFNQELVMFLEFPIKQLLFALWKFQTEIFTNYFIKSFYSNLDTFLPKPLKKYRNYFLQENNQHTHISEDAIIYSQNNNLRLRQVLTI